MKFMRSSKGVRLCEKWVYVKMNGIISHNSSCPRVKLSDRNHFDSSTVEKQMLLPTFQLWQEFLHSLQATEYLSCQHTLVSILWIPASRLNAWRAGRRNDDAIIGELYPMENDKVA